MKIIFLIFLLSLFTNANSDEVKNLNIETLDIGVSGSIKDSVLDKTSAFLFKRSKQKNENIVLAPFDGDFEKFEDFYFHYKKEKVISDWVVIFENQDEILNVEEIIKNNKNNFNECIKEIDTRKEKIFYVRTVGASGNAFNKMMDGLCHFNPKISPIEKLNKITVSSINNYSILDLCKSYPVILGASGILMEHNGDGVILRNKN